MKKYLIIGGIGLFFICLFVDLGFNLLRYKKSLLETGAEQGTQKANVVFNQQLFNLYNELKQKGEITINLPTGDSAQPMVSVPLIVKQLQTP